MSVDDLLVVLYCSLVAVARFKESLQMLGEVRGPFRQEWGDKRVVNEIRRDVSVLQTSFKGGRAVQLARGQHRDYDATRGFPGEDICRTCLSFSTGSFVR